MGLWILFHAYGLCRQAPEQSLHSQKLFLEAALQPLWPDFSLRHAKNLVWEPWAGPEEDIHTLGKGHATDKVASSPSKGCIWCFEHKPCRMGQSIIIVNSTGLRSTQGFSEVKLWLAFTERVRHTLSIGGSSSWDGVLDWIKGGKEESHSNPPPFSASRFAQMEGSSLP